MDQRERRDLEAGFEGRVQLADLLRDRGDFSGAADAYAAALLMQPARADIRVQYGNMLKDCQRLPEAEAAYRRVLEDRPQDWDTHIQLGHVLKLAGRTGEAKAAYRAALEIEPGASSASFELLHLGDTELRSRQLDLAADRADVELLGALAARLAELEDEIGRLRRLLPDALAWTAFPPQNWAQLRRLFDVPPPPVVARSPAVHVLIESDCGTGALLAQIESLLAQKAPAWRATIVCADPAAREAASRYLSAESRIDVIKSLSDLGAFEADWVLLCGRDARLHPHALGWLAYGATHTRAEAFVMDSETILEESGRARRAEPALRQCVDYDSLLNAPVAGDDLFIRADLLSRAALRESADLAAYVASLLLDQARVGAIGHVPLPLTARQAGAASAGMDYRRVVSAHLARCGSSAVVGAALEDGTLDIVWPSAPSQQKISVIIPTRDNAHDVVGFVESLRDKAGDRTGVDILVVDNGGAPAQARILEELARAKLARITRIDVPFNWAHLNNAAVAQADGEILVFANDDMRMLTQSWDVSLRGLLARDEIGAVGARLLYPDGSMQHAGVLTGWRGLMIHDGLNAGQDEPGPGRRWQVARAAAAVTGAFLAVRRADFETVGGFDAASFAVSYNDVDFCLRLREAGKRVLWTPRIALIHHESKSRGADHLTPERRAVNDVEKARFLARWGEAASADPSVNPFWVDFGLPFRLLALPSRERILEHIARTSAQNPWAVRRDPSSSPGWTGVSS